MSHESITLFIETDLASKRKVRRIEAEDESTFDRSLSMHFNSLLAFDLQISEAAYDAPHPLTLRLMKQSNHTGILYYE